MSVEERDFSSFHLGDNVYELANGLIPDIASRLDVSLSSEPTPEGIQVVIDRVGANKVLRENQEVEAISKSEKADMVDRSGVQKELRRSLWTPEVGLEAVEATMFTGGVANWIDRTAAVAIDLKDLGRPVHVLGGTRVMDTATEKVNPNVEALHEANGVYPTEAQYLGEITVPSLVSAGLDVQLWEFDSTNADLMLAEFFEENYNLQESPLAMLRVANAGVIMAVQMRDAVKRLNPNYDSDEEEPMVFVATDTLPVSRSEEQDEDPTHYQKADSAFRQILLTAKKLVEAATAI